MFNRAQSFIFVFHTFRSIQKPQRQLKIFHHKVTNIEFIHARTFAACAFSCAFLYLLGSYVYPDKYFGRLSRYYRSGIEVTSRLRSQMNLD